VQELGVELMECLGVLHEQLLELILGIENSVWVLIDALQVGQDILSGCIGVGCVIL
jgi:hypothetical protein